MDLNGIDLNLLVAFDALIVEHSVTRAGKRIGRTQPAMSAALSRLRALFGDELFVRGSAGLQPTPRALELAEPLGRALADIQRTLNFTQAFDPRSSTATFTLGLAEHPTYSVLPRLLSRVHDLAPDITFHIRSFTARDAAVAMLDAGDADLTIGVPASTQPARILSRPLFDEHFVCVMRRGHPAADAPLDLSAFLALSHLLVSPEDERFGHVDAALARLGRQRRLVLTLPHLYAAPALVACSDLIATLPAGVVAASGHADKLVLLDPPVDLDPVSFFLSWHRRNDVHPAQQWLRDITASLFASGSRLQAQ